MTIQYPEEKTPVYPRFRGRHKLHQLRGHRAGEVRRLLALRRRLPGRLHPRRRRREHPRRTASRAGERYAAVYEINLSRCIFCGYCEIACPFDAITMGHDYEMADYDRADLIFTKEMLLAEPIERTPLRKRGRVAWKRCCSSSSPRSARSAARSASSRMRNPFYSVLALIVHLFSLAVALPAAAAPAFVAAAQVVVYAGAVMVLYVFVVAYVGGGGESAWEPIPGQRFLAPLLGARRSSSSSRSRCSAPRLVALGTDGPDVDAGFGDPPAIGQPAARDSFLLPFEASSILLLAGRRRVGASRSVLAGRRAP